MKGQRPGFPAPPVQSRAYLVELRARWHRKSAGYSDKGFGELYSESGQKAEILLNRDISKLKIKRPQ